MTKKDLTSSENIDLTKDNGLEKKQHSSSEETAEPKIEGHTEIKNAHAAGDGAYGRSDKSVLDNDSDAEGDKERPAY